ncbi:MAG: hypothetical protein QNK75_09330 [Crocinitomicaceae bacterium]
MAKKCLGCDTPVNDKAMECPYCGSGNFQKEEVAPAVKIIIDQGGAKPESDDSNIYSDDIMKLMNLALSDGELTEKEKQVLFKKAEAQGIDLDEFEMVLDSKLSQIKNKSNSEGSPIQSIAASGNSIDKYKELEMLVDLALKDGAMSDFERSTLLEKSSSLGISTNEAMMIIDSKVVENEKLQKQNAAPKSNKFGEIKKCPACGAIAKGFNSQCSDCGHEFSNIGANVSIGKLFEMLNACENERKDEDMSIGGVVGGMFAKALGGGDKIIEKKKSIISGFPISNTKDDILEFLSTAIPNAKKKGNMFTKENPENKSHNDLAPTWKSKCEQIIMKAKFSMKEDKKTLEEIMVYANELGIK